MSSARRDDLAMGAVALLVVVLDQLTKRWIVEYFTADVPKPPISLLGRVLQLEYTANTGVAFSLLTNNATLFFFIALALGVMGTLYWRFRDAGSLPLKLAFGLILGGAAGNLLDRFSRGSVVDFIHFQLPQIHFDFAVFNVADSSICVGVALLAFLLWRSEPRRTAEGQATAQGTTAQGTSTDSAVSTSLPAGDSSTVAPRVRRRVETSR